MKKPVRYEPPSLPDRPGRFLANARAPRYTAHIVVFIIGLAAVVLATVLSSSSQSQAEATQNQSGIALAVPGLKPAPTGLPVLSPAIAGGGLPNPEPELIRRDFVLAGHPGAAVSALSRPRELLIHTVVAGDTLFGIAEKYALRPETVLWSNYALLSDNPDLLSIGQKITIPPQNGLIAVVEQGDTIDGLARRFKVPPEAIVVEPINKLTGPNQLLNIGQEIFVPGGERETVQWQLPQLIEVRRNAVTGVRVYRVGRCGEVAIPPLGTSSFVWPANRHYLSGYNFSAWHPGLDISGRLGDPIYAADSGTVIYAGFSLNAAGRPVGYGQYVVLDHGNGFQTLYAHASQLYVSCGQQVLRGTPIAAIGSIGKSTGPHLHFEIRSDRSAVNPWRVLPAQ
jgi:murein DD-endopeptidase MepM/ murein hydrolase activator NlpD